MIIFCNLFDKFIFINNSRIGYAMCVRLLIKWTNRIESVPSFVILSLILPMQPKVRILQWVSDPSLTWIQSHLSHSSTRLFWWLLQNYWENADDNAASQVSNECVCADLWFWPWPIIDLNSRSQKPHSSAILVTDEY